MSTETRGSILDQEISRRNALKIIGLTAIVAACAPGELFPEQTPNPEIIDGKGELRSYIENLPDSELKDILIDKVMYVLAPTTPRSINLGGYDIPVLYSTVEQTWHDSNHFRGVTKLDTDETRTSGTVASDTTIIVPLPHYLTDAEILKDKPEGLTKEGAPKIPAEAKQGQNIDDSISPSINISLPDKNLHKFDSEHFEEMKKATYVKEALTLAFELEYYERMAEQARGIQQSPLIPLVEGGHANGLTYLFNGLTDVDGRFPAMLDLGSYFLTLRLFKGTETELHIRRDPKINNAYYDLENYLETTTIEDPFEQAIDWALNSPKAKELVHVGNIDDYIK